MRTPCRMRLIVTALATAATTVAVSGCGIDPAVLTVPGSGPDGATYSIHIQFANALNLPSHARVLANGAQVGRLEKLSVEDPSAAAPGLVVAEVQIQDTVALPTSTTAQLRQDTILGDIYISLEIPQPATAEDLPPGGTIPIQQTKPALQVEDLLTGVATFVSGGALRSAQDAITHINAALPADPADTARIAEVLKADLIDIAANQDDLGAFIDSLGTNAELIMDNKAQLEKMITPQGVIDITEIARSLIGLIGIIGALGGLAHALQWLAPLVRNGDAAARAFVPMLFNTARPLNLSAPSNLNRLVAFIDDKLIPWVERPTVNILGVRTDTAPTGQPVSAQDQTAQIVATLRMLGVVR